MHACLLGVAKQFAYMWFDEKNKPYSLSNINYAKVDAYLRSIKVPLQIIPTILQQFPEFKDYTSHWSQFVEALQILLGTTILTSDIEKSELLLRKFVAGTQELYGSRAMTFNIHQMLHLAQSVVDFDPL